MANDMLPEYDFSNAVRGQHRKALDKGYTIHIHQADGSTVVEHYKLVDGAVLLQPDVQAYFPDSDAVNAAPRSLITLMDSVPVKGKKPRRSKHLATPIA